jgi:lipopolysaccharide export system protein LptA
LIRTCALGATISVALAFGAFAQGTSITLGVNNHDSSQPVEITSEELQVDQESGSAIFSGNVMVGQGDITLTCETMRVEFGADPETGKNEIRVIRMSGGVTFVSKDEAAESDAAVYTLTNDLLVMTGNVLVTQGSTALSSDKLTYNLKTGTGVMEGRVKTILQQGSN